jgi:sugar phosphate isomerase/epimerase
MNTYLSTTFVGQRKPVTEVLQDLRAYGVQCVELGSTHTHESELGQKLAEDFGDFSFLTHNFFPPPIADDLVINFSDPRPQMRDASIRQAADNILFADRLGSKLHTIHPGFLAAAAIRPSEERNFDFSFEEPSTDETPKDAFDRMIESLHKLRDRVGEAQVPIAIETQGSATHSHHCLMQTEQEIVDLFAELGSNGFGINVNLGHLNLASKVFGFDRIAFIESIIPHIKAFELSHNDGTGDQHLLLKTDAWYWDVIRDSRFAETPMILEVRDAPIKAACANLALIQNERESARTRTDY